MPGGAHGLRNVILKLLESFAISCAGIDDSRNDALIVRPYHGSGPDREPDEAKTRADRRLI